jgi:predicted  nucleic acid-binding Zn ribbon protein
MIAKISFGKASRKKYSEEEIEEIIPFIGCLRKEGHVFGKELLGIIQDEVVCYVNIYEIFDLVKVCSSKFSKHEFERILKTFGQAPTIEFGEKYLKPRRNVKKTKALLLFTNFLDDASPLVDPFSGMAIPMYRLPLKYETKAGLLHWQAVYKSFDSLFMLMSDRIELANYKQIADPNSDFGLSSRRIAIDLEKETGIPTYTYFHRYFSLKTGEDELPCPICLSPWTKSHDFGVKLKFVDWICHKCRIMSCKGVSEEGSRKAKIGIKTK